jgi:hypothetical protein
MNESDRPRNPPHLINAFGEFCVLNGSQWIATGFALAMTKFCEGCPREDNLCETVL